MQFTLTGKYVYPLEFTIEECDDGFRWEAVDDKVCLYQGDKPFATEAEAQMDVLKWFKAYDQEHADDDDEICMRRS